MRVSDVKTSSRPVRTADRSRAMLAEAPHGGSCAAPGKVRAADRLGASHGNSPQYGPYTLRSALIALVLALVAVSGARAESQSPMSFFLNGGAPPPNPAEAKTVTVVEHLSTQLPLDLSFVDENGQSVQLKQYFNGKKPVVLQMGYFGCPMLCSLVSQGLVNSLKDVKLNAGSDYEVVYVSIDPTEGPGMANAKKQAYMQAYGHGSESAAGWHLLTGKQQQIQQLAGTVGFQYKWIDSAGQFSHPACLMVCTPDGRLSRYLYGVKFDPQTVRLSLVEASNGKIGSTADAFILTCFQYDGTTGRYALVAINLMKLGGVVVILGVAGMVAFFARKGSRRTAG
jgi:protein SCO1